MPAVSFYLNQETLDAVRARAKTQKTPVSRIIRKAIEQYLAINESESAREQILNLLVKEKPLGGTKAWESIHEERTDADACRS